jgi:acyl-CoA hydrolase
MPKKLTADECAQFIKSNDNVLIHSGVSAPQQLVKAMVARSSELRNVNIYQIHTEGDCSYAKTEYKESFNPNNFFNGHNMRGTNKELTMNYIPIFLSEIPMLFYNGIINLDVVLIQVSPPDAHGICSLGPSVDITISGVRTAKIVIAQINKNMPRTFGDGQVPFKKINYFMECEDPIVEINAGAISPVEKKIGQQVASLIEDGATLQMGIGAIPNATLVNLYNHHNLGIHSEMFSDGIIDLYERGVITGRFKKRFRGKIVTSFAVGSKRLYDFIDDNPEVLFLDCMYTNRTHIIAENPKVTAINSAIEIDLTGQVCADSIGSRIYSGVGGQVDFIRAAALSDKGKAIIALPSTTGKGVSKIVTSLKQGAGVVTTRAHVHYVVTEHGIAYLYGKTIRERIKELIKIAAPEFRESLEREAFDFFK